MNVMFKNKCQISLQKPEGFYFHGLQLNCLYLPLPAFCSICICCPKLLGSCCGRCQEELSHNILSNVSYGMDMLDSNKATEVLKYSNKICRAIWVPSVPGLSFGHSSAANQTFSISQERRTLNVHTVPALLPLCLYFLVYWTVVEPSMESDPYKGRSNVLGREYLQCPVGFVDDLGPRRESLSSTGTQH